MSLERLTHTGAGRVAGCAAGQRAATLSAWRDGALPSARAAAVARHTAICAACHDRLQRYATLAEGLRAVATPAPVGGYGLNPRLGEPSVQSIAPRPPRLARLPELPWRAWPARLGWLGAAAAVLLLVVALSQWLRPLAQQPLVWQAAAPLPGGINLTTPTGDVVLAPGDGNTGYACAPSDTPGATGGTVIRVWRTRDRAATWTPIFTMPAVPRGVTCLVAVDAGDALTATLSVVLPAATATPPASYVTRDGGATWHVLPGGPVIRQLARARGAAYALAQAPDGQLRLVVSRDGLASWAPADQVIEQASAAQRLQAFWLDPASGALLVATADLPSGDARLWSSADAGQHWTELSVAAQAGGFVARPATGHGWHICAASYDPASAAAPNTLTCSDDGGRTWAAHPALNPSTAAGGVHAAAIPQSALFAMTGDGALLALAPTGADGQPVLYRLAASASQWQARGLVPEPVVRYAAAPGAMPGAMPGAGVLWALPSATALDPQRRVFTAASP